MHLIDIYPAKGTFTPGEPISLFAELLTKVSADATIQLAIYHLADSIAEIEIPVSLDPGAHRVSLLWQPETKMLGGYGVRATLVHPRTEREGSYTTAFDVLTTWSDYPRYGFLCDFGPGRQDVEQVLDALLKYHINGLQFYDWLYRHDTLVSPTEEYVDPLGRPLSLHTVERFVGAAHQRGMAAMPYLAVYAASLEFARTHPDWALYDELGKPYTFEDFLGLMDPSPGSPWIRHLLDQCGEALKRLSFDGLHVDQYGEPRSGFTAAGEPVDIPTAFASFVELLKKRYGSAPVTFNAVKNWPIDSLAKTPQDYLYIELWPSTPYYRDILNVVLESRGKSSGKPLVIAIYLPAERPINVRLVDALILSGGATRIELGEDQRLLSDPYFPKHQAIDLQLKRILRAYADFAVRYGELIGPRAEDLADLELALPDGVWSVARRSGSRLAINLINMAGLEDPVWTESHPAPQTLNNFPVRLFVDEKVQHVFYTCPDNDDLAMKPLSWSSGDRWIEVIVPSLEFWTMLVIETLTS